MSQIIEIEMFEDASRPEPLGARYKDVSVDLVVDPCMNPMELIATDLIANGFSPARVARFSFNGNTVGIWALGSLVRKKEQPNVEWKKASKISVNKRNARK